MRRAGNEVKDKAVEELLCRLKDDDPDLVDPPDDEPDGERFRRRPDPSLEEWRRISSHPSPGD